MIRILIVHGNPMFRAGLRSVLERHKEMHLVGEAVEREQLLDLTAATHPDVVLFDGALTSCQPACSAVEMVAQVRSAGARGIIVFACSTDEESLFRFLMNGAAAYELPTITGDDLVEKIRRVADGEYLITGAVLGPVSSPSRPRRQKRPQVPPGEGLQPPVVVAPAARLAQATDASPTSGQLTAREVAILKLTAQGRSNRQIAQALGLGAHTIKNYMTCIHQKLGVLDRTAAVVVALCRKLISLDDAKPSAVVLDEEAFAQRSQRYTVRKTASQPDVASRAVSGSFRPF